jgi:methyltransferase
VRVTPLFLVIAFIAAERGTELLVARRNTRRLRQLGAVEVGAGHYPLIVALHAAWLVALLLVVPAETPPDLLLLGAFFVLQLGRVWVIATLGRRWTTRIIVLPGAPLVHSGPYRFCRHPNYLIVAGEMALVPLAFGAWALALVFSAANLALTWWRVRVEERALAPLHARDA